MATPRNPLQAFIWGQGGAALTPEEIAMQREMMARRESRGIDTSPVGHWSQGAARVVDALGGVLKQRRLDKAAMGNEAANAELSAPLIAALSGGAAYPSSVAAGGGSMAPEAVGIADAPTVTPEIREGIASTAASLGIDPVDLATAISYETGGTFNPTQGGPTTKHGKHRGFIQFGEPQAQQYGVDWSNPVASQLGPDGAVAKYLRDRGVKPGMGMLDIYSTINAGAPGLYNRSDAAAGGAPGTVADKVNSQMAGHRAKALALFGNSQTSPAAAAINAVAPVQTASLDPSVGMNSFSPEQLASGNDATAVSMTPAPGATPYTGPGAQTGQPMLIYDKEGMRMGSPGIATGDPTPNRVTADPLNDPSRVLPIGTPGLPTGAASVSAGVPMEQPPTPDITAVPAISGANGLPFEPPAPVVPTGAPQTGIERVTAALPIRPVAAPGDVMVAGRDQTEQPVIEPTGPAMPAEASGGNPIAAAVRAMSDPRASAQTKQVAALVIQQAQARERAQAENQQWYQRQAYERQAQEADPKRKLEIQKLQRDIDSGSRLPLINAGDGNVFDPNTNTWMTAPNSGSKKAPTVQDFYDEKTGQNYKAQWNPDTQNWDRVGGAKVSSDGLSVTTNPDGTVSVVQGSGAKPLTEGQSKDTVFATRATGALPNVDKYGDKLASFGENVAANTPVFGNYLKSEEYQQAEQAGKEFLQAVLRKDTGAAITPQETAEYGTVYLPRPGDKPAVLAQKKASRTRAIEAIKAGIPPQGLLQMEKALIATNSSLPEGVSEEDILETMRANGMTREQVMERLNGGS